MFSVCLKKYMFKKIITNTNVFYLQMYIVFYLQADWSKVAASHLKHKITDSLQHSWSKRRSFLKQPNSELEAEYIALGKSNNQPMWDQCISCFFNLLSSIINLFSC